MKLEYHSFTVFEQLHIVILILDEESLEMELPD